MTNPELLVTISASAAAVCSIINMVGRYWGRTSGKAIVDKLDEAKADREGVKKTLTDTNAHVATVHEISNGRLTAALKRVDEVEAMNKVLIAQIERRAIDRRAPRRGRTRLRKAVKGD